jgi:hypothetical protein
VSGREIESQTDAGVLAPALDAVAGCVVRVARAGGVFGFQLLGCWSVDGFDGALAEALVVPLSELGLGNARSDDGFRNSIWARVG